MDKARGELADFLRTRRQRLTPEMAGLSPGRRRRTPGLRREEVAELAGIGVDWLTRLEQGRSGNPSPATVDALARALKLPKADHAHLKALARGGERPAFVKESVPEAVRHIVRSLDQPAYVTGRRWDVLAWNDAAEDLFAFGRLPDGERNTLVHMMTSPGARKLFGAGWAEEARRMTAQFRTNYDVFTGDPAFEEIIARLRRESAEFGSWWSEHDIRNSSAGRKALHHRERGAVHLVYATFQSNDDPALKLVIYAPG